MLGHKKDEAEALREELGAEGYRVVENEYWGVGGKGEGCKRRGKWIEVECLVYGSLGVGREGLREHIEGKHILAEAEVRRFRQRTLVLLGMEALEIGMTGIRELRGGLRGRRAH